MREEKEFATTGKQKVSVREETNAVSDTRVMIVKNRHQKPLHPLSHHHQEVGVRREERSLRGRSPSGKTNRQPCKNLLKGTCTKLPCDYWHPPGCQFYQSESGCNFGTDCSFPHWKVEEQPSKRTRKGGDKRAVATVKDVRLGCESQDVEPASIFSDFTEGHKIFATSSTSTIHKSCAPSSKHQRKPRSIAE